MNSLSLNLLQLISKRKELSLHDLCVILNADPVKLSAPLNDLLKHGAIEILPYYASEYGNELTLRAPFQITYLGKTLLEQENLTQKHYKYDEFRARSTLAIALIALVCSILSLVLQLMQYLHS